MKVVLAGPDRGLTAAFEDAGADVARIEGLVTAARLEAAGLASADLFVLTDVSEATSIPLAKDIDPDVRVVVYSPETVPEFVRGQLDLALDPALFPPDLVVDELLD